MQIQFQNSLIFISYLLTYLTIFNITFFYLQSSTEENLLLAHGHMQNYFGNVLSNLINVLLLNIAGLLPFYMFFFKIKLLSNIIAQTSPILALLPLALIFIIWYCIISYLNENINNKSSTQNGVHLNIKHSWKFYTLLLVWVLFSILGVFTINFFIM